MLQQDDPEKAIAIIQFFQNFWGWFAAALAGILARFVTKRVSKSYTDDLDNIREDIQAIKLDIHTMKQNDYLPRVDADKMVEYVRQEHKRMFNEQLRRDDEQTEAIKHLGNRMDDIYNILVKK